MLSRNISSQAGGGGYKISVANAMTAILRIGTTDGFVVASDGRLRDTKTLAVNTDDAQKIFPIGQHAAYSLCGAFDLASGIGNPFSFREALANAVVKHPIDKASSLDDYVRTVAETVHTDLKTSHASRQLEFPEDLDGTRSGTILHVFFDGYVRGVAESMTVRFFHRKGDLPTGPDYMPETLGRAGFGSALVQKEIELRNPALDKYRNILPVGSKPFSPELCWALSEALTYITACASKDGLRIDAKQCPGIGGRIQMAKITPRVGFHWIRGFVASSVGSGFSPDLVRSSSRIWLMVGEILLHCAQTDPLPKCVA